MAITPPDIALAMRRMGWNNASALMARWANGSAWTMTDAIKDGETDPTTLSAAQVDTSTITMAWLKGFPGPRAAYDDLRANALNVHGQNELRDSLRKAGWQRGAFVLGSTRLAAPQLDALGYVNSRPFGSKADTLNDLYGAIGEGMLHAAAVGRVEARDTRHDQRHARDVKPSPTTRRRGLDRAWQHSMTVDNESTPRKRRQAVAYNEATSSRRLQQVGAGSTALVRMRGPLAMNNPAQATSSRRLQPVGAGSTALVRMRGPLAMNNPTQATSSRRLQPVGAGLTALG